VRLVEQKTPIGPLLAIGQHVPFFSALPTSVVSLSSLQRMVRLIHEIPGPLVAAFSVWALVRAQVENLRAGFHALCEIFGGLALHAETVELLGPAM